MNNMQQDLGTKDNIFLIGFMGAGKSTVAQSLQRMFHMDLIEMDQVIAEQEGCSIPEIFSSKGESYFRDLESALLRKISQSHSQIISCGGGAVLRRENIEEMKRSGKVVLLTAAPETILERIGKDDTRPVLKNKKTVEGIAQLMEERRARYEAAADIIQPTDSLKINDICMEIARKTGLIC